ncbi:hypothetical protein JR316_0013511 [Psilocybe cubensis]|uniref:Uncharacterized protein n=2 Tax=Psilocybe cubensis TaxID=181762 RepID=A0A8H7XJG8_PSICU|nr:uncharacterized protein JR316_0013511 [Psilocybe cubensis]KAH9474196.1 hypothetical protein JR316_0013511 [Psilocybe cubensis]
MRPKSPHWDSPNSPTKRPAAFYGNSVDYRGNPSSSRLPSQVDLLLSTPSRRSQYPNNTAVFSEASLNIEECREEVGKMMNLMSTAHTRLENLPYGQPQSWIQYWKNERAAALVAIRRMLGNMNKSNNMTPAEYFLQEFWRDPENGVPLVLPTVAYTDACNKGIGFFMPAPGGHQQALGLAWSWKTGKNYIIPRILDGSVYASWGELIAVEITLETLLTLHQYESIQSRRYPPDPPCFVILSDNQDVVTSLSSQNRWVDRRAVFLEELDSVVGRIGKTCLDHNVQLHVRWIRGSNNYADPWSRMEFSKENADSMEEWHEKIKMKLFDHGITVPAVPYHHRLLLEPCWFKHRTQSFRGSPRKSTRSFHPY